MTISRKGQIQLALAAALSALALALTAAAPAHAYVNCAVDPTFCTPTFGTVTLTVTPPSAGRVTSSANPVIDCGAGGASTCAGSMTWECPLGPGGSCIPAMATLVASDAPAGKLAQWSSNCTPDATNPLSCTVRTMIDQTVTLTWIDDPSAKPPVTTTTTTTTGDQGSQPQQQLPPQQPVIAPAKASCKVPKLKGKTLAAARKALRKANCALGKVKKKTVKRGKAGRVLAQGVKAGATKPNGAKVALTVSRRR